MNKTSHPAMIELEDSPDSEIDCVQGRGFESLIRLKCSPRTLVTRILGQRNSKPWYNQFAVQIVTGVLATVVAAIFLHLIGVG